MRVCSGECVHLALHLSRLLFHPSLPLTSPIPSIHSSSQPASQLFIRPSLRIRPSIPVQSIIFPVPKEGAKTQLSLGWAAGTQSSPDEGLDRFTHLPADTACEKRGALSPSLPPPSFRRGSRCHRGPCGSLVPRVDSLLRSWIPGPAGYLARLLGRPLRLTAPEAENFFLPISCFFFWKQNLGALDTKRC